MLNESDMVRIENTSTLAVPALICLRVGSVSNENALYRSRGDFGIVSGYEYVHLTTNFAKVGKVGLDIESQFM